MNRKEFLKLSALFLGGIPLRKQFESLFGAEFSFDEIRVLEQDEWGVAKSINMQVIRIPLMDDGFWRESKPIKLFTLGEGVELGYSKRRTLKIGDRVVHAVLIPSSIGGNHIHVGVIGIEDDNGYQELASLDNGKDGRNIFSIIGEYYPNKILNIIEGATRTLRGQREYGFLTGGRQYSLLTLMGIDKEDRGFLTGYTTFHLEVNAGGICGFGTTFANSVAKNSSIDQHWEHPAKSKYFVPPADPVRSESTTDASLSWVGDEWFDILFTPEEDSKLYMTCELIKTGEEDVDELGPETDMLMVLSLHWISDAEKFGVVDGLGELEEIRENYLQFRDGAEVDNFPRNLETIEWVSGKDEVGIIKSVYPEEVVDHFIPELHRDKWIKFVKQVVDEINIYAETYKGNFNSDVLEGKIIGLGNYLKEKIFFAPEYYDESGVMINSLRDAIWHLYFVDYSLRIPLALLILLKLFHQLH